MLLSALEENRLMEVLPHAANADVFFQLMWVVGVDTFVLKNKQRKQGSRNNDTWRYIALAEVVEKVKKRTTLAPFVGGVATEEQSHSKTKSCWEGTQTLVPGSGS